MKIAFDVSQVGPGKAGCGFYAASLMDGLLAAGSRHSFTLLTSFGDFYHNASMALAFPWRSSGVRYGPRHLRRSDAERFWRSEPQVRQLLEAHDLCHANNFWSPPWLIQSRLVYTLYDMSFAEHPGWNRSKNRLGCFHGVLNAALYADWFVAISESTKRAFLHHFPHVESDRIRVIYPASRFDQPGFQVTPQRPSAALFATQQPFLLSVGTLEPRKNQRFLVDVYQRFRERGGPAVPLVLAGGRGWLMEDFVGSLKASPWGQDIHWLGFVSEAELAWLYGHCLAMLYPSHYEGFGLPVLEAMALGAAVVSSNRTSMPEIVGDAGILLAPDDRDAWVEALEALCADTSWRQTLSSAGRRRSRHFDWQRSTRQLLDLYDEALQTKAA